jgi:putative intracellular protease/amidase
MPLPDRDFDVTEVSVPWKLLTEAGHEVVFATESGATPAADPLLLTGVLFGQLGAEAEPKEFYRELEETKAFRSPLSWRGPDLARFDALFLAGGHAPGMRQYLGSSELQLAVASFWSLARPICAICHGVIVLARAIDPASGNSVLHGRRTTCLPRYLERLAYWMTAWQRGRYYRTYPTYVEAEVRVALRSDTDFDRGPITIGARGTRDDDGPAFVVEDGNYVSGRWPGDAYLVARRFAELLERAGTLVHNKTSQSPSQGQISPGSIS